VWLGDQESLTSFWSRGGHRLPALIASFHLADRDHLSRVRFSEFAAACEPAALADLSGDIETRS